MKSQENEVLVCGIYMSKDGVCRVSVHKDAEDIVLFIMATHLAEHF